ncbi:hypothetical protein AAG906_013505 [Vitis piasezkii]
MENTKQVGSSSSITSDLFGPKDSLLLLRYPPASSAPFFSCHPRYCFFCNLFYCIFLCVPGRNSSHTGNIGSFRKQGSGNQVGNGKHGTPDNITQICNGESSKDRGSIYHNETVEPCYFSSSIYYGGQEVYSPNARNTESHPIVTIKKDGGEDDLNGSNSNSASRGNWWQGSLYY